MEKTHITIIGAGIVGLAIAEQLSGTRRDILVLEKSDRFGTETSSRNSEVIHAGFYYPSGSLKARLCLEGNRLVYQLCEKHSIPSRKTGKIVVACDDEEVEKIHSLYRQGIANGVPGLELVSSAGISEMEPDVRALEGIYSESTGIVDSHRLMALFEFEALERGVTIAYNCEAVGIRRDSDFILSVRDSDGETMEIMSEIVINAAGLHSDKIAAMAGLDIDSENLRQHFCKGEYFGLSARHNNKLKHLVYPAPTPVSLGTHAVLKLDGSLKLGPNAFYVETIDYDVDPAHIDGFFKQSSKFMPFLEHADLYPDMAGIRPKLQTEGEPVRDFVIRDESEAGLGGLINLIGIESPGLTSAPAIAGYVEKLL